MPTVNYHPSWHVRCLSVPGPDTDLSLYISFDNARFLFGCGEGTQRAFVQRRLSMKGINGIFVGGGSSRGRNGLSGVLMTAADTGMSQVDIAGPPDISHYIATLRSCVTRDSLKVVMHPYPAESSNSSEMLYELQNITVRAVALQVEDSESRPIIESGHSESVESSAEAYVEDMKMSSDIETTGEIIVDQETLTQSASNSPTSPKSLPYYEIYKYLNHKFRPTHLSRPDLQKWCDTIVGDMFPGGSRPRAPGRKTPYTSSTPFVTLAGFLRPAKPSNKHPLPMPSVKEATTEMVYIFQAPPVRGKFDVGKANALKVPNGPIRGKLVQGENIEVDDPEVPGGKRVVRPEDCLVGGGPGAVLIVVTCSPSNLSALLSSPAFHPYQPLRPQVDGVESIHVHLVVHKVPSVLWRDKRYQEWMAAFGKDTQHLIAESEDYSNDVYFTSAAWNTLQLSLTDHNIFPPSYSESDKRFEPIDLPPNTSLMVTNHMVKMHPPSLPEILPNHDKDLPYPSTSAEISEVAKDFKSGVPEYRSAASAVQQSVSLKEPPPRVVGDDITVTTLGTGSALPSKYRNVSSTHLDIPGLGGVLLDAGEGTLGQLRRRYGPEGVRQIYANLRMIFISHMHADHHLGLPSILEDRFKQGFSSKLYLVAPGNIALNLTESASWQLTAPQAALDNLIFIDVHRLAHGTWRPELSNHSYLTSPHASASSSSMNGESEMGRQERESTIDIQAVEDAFDGVRKWPAHNVLHDSQGSFVAAREDMRARNSLIEDLGLQSISTPRVDHRCTANGLVMEHVSGWKIVYSGDTMPCEALVQAGKNATLLIHEATLEDDKVEMAAKKGHSTFSQAIDIGTRMKARHILLNHFSQRYPKLPKLPEPVSSEGVVQPIISISFDLMSIQLKDMWKMAHYMEAISLLFKGETEEGEDVTAAVASDINPSIDVDEEPGSQNMVTVPKKKISSKVPIKSPVKLKTQKAAVPKSADPNSKLSKRQQKKLAKLFPGSTEPIADKGDATPEPLADQSEDVTVESPVADEGVHEEEGERMKRIASPSGEVPVGKKQRSESSTDKEEEDQNGIQFDSSMANSDVSLVGKEKVENLD